MDILLFKHSPEIVKYSGIVAEGTNPALLSGRVATRTETLANKVIKFLLTSLGTDPLDPEYGSYLPTYTQIDYNALARIFVEMQDDLVRCYRYVTAKEKDIDDTIEKLASLKLVDLIYAPESLEGVLIVKIQVLTTFNNDALLNLAVNPYVR